MRESIAETTLETVAIESVDEVVTLDIRGNFGFGYHAYELDLAPSGADELALWLIRTATEVRAEMRTASGRKRPIGDDHHSSSRVGPLVAKTPSVDPADPWSVTEDDSGE